MKDQLGLLLEDKASATILAELDNPTVMSILGNTPHLPTVKSTPSFSPFGYKSLPNARQINLKLFSLDPVFAEQGSKRRLKKAEIKIVPYRNKQINRYLEHMFLSLRSNKHNPQLYWRIAKVLMRSSSYQSAGLRAIHPNWHRDLPLHEVQSIMAEVKMISYHLLGNLDPVILYHRVKIPKPDGSQRDINSPSIAWRIVLRNLNDILQVYLEDYIPDNQHGFSPGKGVTTAWESIITKLDASPDIYEFDLRKFFDSLSKRYLLETLIKVGLPLDIALMFIKLTQSPPSNGKSQELTWTDDLQKSQQIHYYLTGDWSDSPPDYSSTVYWDKPYEYYNGVLQGLPTSPLLSSVSLIQTLLHPSHQDSLVQYADDGIIFSSDPESILSFPPESGIQVNWDKSGWIRRNNIDLKPLKFLGLSYHEGKLMASTRSGKFSTFDSYKLLEQSENFKQHVEMLEISLDTDSIEEAYENWKNLSPHYKSVKRIATVHDLVHEQLLGYVQSLLYQGISSPTSIEQDFRYTHKQGSWSSIESQRHGERYLNGELTGLEITIWNSSSIAHQYLMHYLTTRCPSHPLQQLGLP